MRWIAIALLMLGLASAQVNWSTNYTTMDIPSGTGTLPIEQMFGQLMDAAMGSQTIIGLFIVLVFVMIAILQGGGMELKAMTILGGVILALPFISWLFYLMMLVIGVLIYLAYMKFVNR